MFIIKLKKSGTKIRNKICNYVAKAKIIRINRNMRTYYIQKKRMRRTSESASHPPWIFSTYHKIAAADRILLKIIDK